MYADQALARLLEMPNIRTVLDIGCGNQEHANRLRDAGKQVTTVALSEPADVQWDYLGIEFLEPFDAIWASHVLEHSPNPGLFLNKCFDDLRRGGALVVTVPPAKHNLVGGHVSLWNEGILLYHLILAGFDCRQARVGVYDYNISVIVSKPDFPVQLPPIAMDTGDIERLAEFFPCPVHQNMDGRLGSIHWGPACT